MSKWQALKGVSLGRTTMSTGELRHTLLPKILALPVFSSDPLSSNAYAIQEILLVLAIVGASALSLVVPIAFFVAILLATAVVSYRQTVRAYPNGGGAYIVSNENLGMYPGLLAAAALRLFGRPAPLPARPLTEPRPFSLATVEPWEAVTCTGTIHSILIDPRFSPTRVDVTIFDDTASLKVRLHVDRRPLGLRVGDELLVDGLVRPGEDGSGLVVIPERWVVAQKAD